MTRTVTIDGREVKFRTSAAIPRLYRIKFRRDIIQDMDTLQKAMRESDATASTIPPAALELFENIAYLMARHADPDNVPDDVDAWLEQFDTFSIYEIMPVIAEMWADNIAQIEQPAKK